MNLNFFLCKVEIFVTGTVQEKTNLDLVRTGFTARVRKGLLQKGGGDACNRKAALTIRSASISKAGGFLLQTGVKKTTKNWVWGNQMRGWGD